MKGTVDKNGMIVITFDPESEMLRATLPNTKYMPCQKCGTITGVALNILKYFCVTCNPIKKED